MQIAFKPDLTSYPPLELERKFNFPKHKYKQESFSVPIKVDPIVGFIFIGAIIPQ